MTVGIVNNWSNLSVEGTIRPDAIDCPSIKVDGVDVIAPTPVANIPDATTETAVDTINAILAAMVTLGLMEAGE